jgi:hypothetical protein
MNPEAILQPLKRDPFVPLRLTLTTGETVDITHPGAVFLENLAVHIFGVKRKGDHIADWFRLVSLRHIVKVEPIAEPASA